LPSERTKNGRPHIVPLSKPAQDILAPADAVEITTSGGETLQSGPVEFARGSHQRPLSRDELWVKFTDCLGPQFTDAKKSRAFEKLMIFDRLNGAGDLVLQDH
jgi:hypothetical protein